MALELANPWVSIDWRRSDGSGSRTWVSPGRRGIEHQVDTDDVEIGVGVGEQATITSMADLQTRGQKDLVGNVLGGLWELIRRLVRGSGWALSYLERHRESTDGSQAR